MKKQRRYIFLIFLLGITVYANTLGNDFQFDDHRLLGQIKEVKSIGQVISFKVNSRALSTLTFYLNYRFSKLNVVGYHLVNIFVHILTALLIYWIVHLLANSKSEILNSKLHLPPPTSHFPLFTALLCLVHPLCTEPVNYIIARYSLLATMFSFLSLFFFILYFPPKNVVAPACQSPGGTAGRQFIEPEGRPINPAPLSEAGRGRATTGRKKIYLLGTVFSVILAMYSKEVGLFYALTGIFLYWYIFHFEKKFSIVDYFRKKLTAISIFRQSDDSRTPMDIGASERRTLTPMNRGKVFYFGAILILISILISFLFLGEGILGNIRQRLEITLKFVGLKYFLTENKVFLKYLQLLVLPVGLAVDREITWAKGVGEINTFLPLIFNLFILVLAFYLRKKNKIVSFSLFWLVLFHLPYFFLTSKELMVEYRTYPMIFGFVLLLVWSIERLFQVFRLKFSVIVFVLIALVFSFLTVSRNRVWRDGITLWADAVKKSPNNARAHNNLGLSYFNYGLHGLAIRHFEEALRLEPHSAEVYNNLGTAYSKEGKFDEAIACFKKGLKIRPGQVEIYYNLGEMYRNKGWNDLAIESYKEALKLNPRLHQARYGLGIIYAKKKEYDLALEEFKKIIKEKPDDAVIHNALGNVYDLKGDYEEALLEYEEAIKIDPQYAQAYYNSGITYEKKDLYQQAIIRYEKAIALKSDYAAAHNNLGNVYYKQGKYRDAIVHFEKALQIEPNFVDAKNNLEEVKKKHPIKKRMFDDTD